MTKILPFVAQYLAGILNGLVNVVAIWVLIYTLHKNNPVFSMLTALLYLFPSYFNLLDLGTHNLFVNEWNKSDDYEDRKKSFVRLMMSRLILACGAVAFSLVHSWVSGFSIKMTFALVAFISSFFPICLFHTLDSYHIVKYQAHKAVAVKFIRIFATVFFVATTYFEHDNVVLPPVIYSLILWVLGAILIWIMAKRGLFSLGFQFSLKEYIEYLRQSFKYGAMTLLQVLHHASYFSIATNLLGEGGMAPFTVATYIAVPFYLLLQLVNHIKLPELSKATITRNYELVRKKVSSIQLLLLALCFFGVLIIPVLSFFKGYVESMLPDGVIFYAFLILLYNCNILLSNPIVVVSQYAMRKKRIMLAFVVIWLLSLPVVWGLSYNYELKGFLISHFFFSIPFSLYLQNQMRQISKWAFYVEADGKEVLPNIQASNT